MSKTYLRMLAALEYVDPVHTLLRYRAAEHLIATSDLPENVRTLRTQELKRFKEGRDGLLFAIGLSKAGSTKVMLALHEAYDFDFVLRWVADETVCYMPVQLKELVYEARNPKASIQQIIDSASKAPSTETALLIRVNRLLDADIDLRQLPLKDIPYGALWLLWARDPYGEEWSILGDALTLPYRYDFRYPVADDGDIEQSE